MARRRDDSSEPDFGQPRFRHNQWTFEGQLERLGVFGRAAARKSTLARWVALLLVLAIIVPAVAGALSAIF